MRRTERGPSRTVTHTGRPGAPGPGCGRRTIDVGHRRLVEAGDWVRVHPRTYHATDHPFGPRTRVRAAALWAGDRAALIGGAAAWWWRISEDAPTVVQLAAGSTSGSRAPAGVSISRPTTGPTERVRVDGLWVVHRSPAVLGAAVGLGLLHGARLVDQALQSGSVTVEGLRAVLSEYGARAGVVVARELVDLAAGGARSEAERRAVRELRGAGIRGWSTNYEVDVPGWGRAILDLAFPARRLVIEVDGWAFHRDVDRFRADVRRQNALILAGWTVIRVTWYDLVEDPAGVVRSVESALASCAA